MLRDRKEINFAVSEEYAPSTAPCSSAILEQNIPSSQVAVSDTSFPPETAKFISLRSPSWSEIKKAYRSLLMHRLRSFLSTLGILFGVSAVIAMLSIGEGAKQETLEQIAQLGMNSILIRSASLTDKGSLTIEDGETLGQNIPALLHYAPLKVLEASLQPKSPLSPEILAVTRSFGDMKRLPLAEGRFICELDQKGKGMVCVLGYEVAKYLGTIGHVGRSIRIEKNQFEIVGILSPTHWKPGKNGVMASRNLDQAIMIPLGSEQALSHGESLSEILLQMEDPNQMGMAVPLVKKILHKLHKGEEDYQVIVPRELLQQAVRTQHTFNLVLGSIAAISLLVGGIGIMNIMLATVSERTREIGIRRAMGANQTHILKQFLFETVLLTLTGAVAGVFLGLFASFAIHYFAGWTTIVTAWSVILALILSSTVGLCSGLYPAYRAAKMDPIQALRFT